MLGVETNHQIILLYFREGLSIRKIAKKFNICRASVKARPQFCIVFYNQNITKRILRHPLYFKCYDNKNTNRGVIRKTNISFIKIHYTF